MFVKERIRRNGDRGRDGSRHIHREGERDGERSCCSIAQYEEKTTSHMMREKWCEETNDWADIRLIWLFFYWTKMKLFRPTSLTEFALTISVTHLKKGDSVLAFAKSATGRHFGMEVSDEYILEK